MMKVATEEEVRELEAPRPDADVDQSVWRLGIERAAESIKNWLKETMQSDELKLKLREVKLSGAVDTREMSVSAVETRLQNIQKCRDQVSQPSVASIFQNNEGTSSSSSGAGIKNGKDSQAGSKSSNNTKKVKGKKDSKKKS
jgi:hypothetical protein